MTVLMVEHARPDRHTSDKRPVDERNGKTLKIEPDCGRGGHAERVHWLSVIRWLGEWLREWLMRAAAATLIVACAARTAHAVEWQALNRSLRQQGLDFHLVYTGAVFGDLSGGVRRSARYLDTIDLQLTADAGRLVGWPGATLFLDGLGTHGDDPSELVGDAQGVSNLTAPSDWKLYEAWIQQNLFANRLSLLVGRYDLNTEFYTLRSAQLFLNSSFGIGPEFSQSGHGGPSIFPDTAVGARLEVKPVRHFEFRAAVLDGVPVDRPGGGKGIFEAGDGLLLVGEADYLTGRIEPGANAATDSPPSKQRGHRSRIGRPSTVAFMGKIALGGWYYTAQFDDLSAVQANGNPVEHRGSGGLYLVAERVVYTDADDPARRLTLFMQMGYGDARVNQFGSYTGGGLTLSAPLPGRDADEAGVGVAAAHTGSHYKELSRTEGTPVVDAEVAIELTYLVQLTPWLAIQPDLQYVIDPSAQPGVSNALVSAIELQLQL
jgi:porin